MSLRKQILLSILGITVIAQIAFGLLAYRQITESRGDQLSIFLQYLNREIAEYMTFPDNQDVTEIYLEELRKKFSTPDSILLIQKQGDILYASGNISADKQALSEKLKAVASDSNQHGLLHVNGKDYYWGISDLPDKNYQLVMLEPTNNEEQQITSVLKQRLLAIGLLIVWLAVWVSLFLGRKISHQLEEKNLQLKHMALHDSLTGLPNRKLLNDRLEQLLMQADRQATRFALFLIDLDRFKEINDTLGHHFGDELLKMVCERITGAVRMKDTVARLGGDEFAVLLPQTDIEGAHHCARRILKAMDAPFTIEGITTESKASIGIVMFPEHGHSIDALIQHADIAMYQAKQSQSGFAIYDSSSNTHSLRRLRLMNDLRSAIANREIQLVYQPLLSSKHSTITGVEVLARWRHAELGDISPTEFIPMAEQTGLIRELTLQLFERAVEKSLYWQQMNFNLCLNINLSTYCLQDFSLPDEINRILSRQPGISAGRIELEITESALMNDLGRARKILEKLSQSGLKLAIDDFGTGFSSLNYLKCLPIDTIKIDRSFLVDMHDSSNDFAIVKTIVELGHNLGCRVVAEGVENRKTADSLIALNVDVMQGYFFGEPMDFNSLTEWLEKQYNSDAIVNG